MKGFFRAGGVLLLVAALAVAGRSWSQTKPAPQPPRTRVALVNLTHVLKKYDKAKEMMGEMRAALAPFQKKDAELKAQLDKLDKLLKEQPEEAARQREQIEKEMTALRREIEDVQKEAKTTISAKQDAQLVTLYRDLREAATRYAKAHDIELVLHYSDADEAGLDNPINVARKMQAGACLPLYAVPRLDITDDVLEILNEKKRGDAESSEPGKP
jgi:Skp family chaperone for outer membrane proteins